MSLTNEWTSTHVAYLEWLSLNRGMSAGRYTLVNGNRASNPFTPEPLEADCKEFMDTIAVLLATLGAPVLEPIKPTATASSTDSSNSAGFAEELFFQESGCEAKGYQTSEGLLVLAGSKGRAALRPSAPPNLAGQRDSLNADGIIKLEDQELVFLKDHLFASPSAAGSILVGGTNNGRTSWRNAAGQSINDLEQRALSAASGSRPNEFA
ncbi:DUF4357 domain-containing protein [Mycobacterium sp. LTG2003]